jgi:hypothetical protein
MRARIGKQREIFRIGVLTGIVDRPRAEFRVVAAYGDPQAPINLGTDP